MRAVEFGLIVAILVAVGASVITVRIFWRSIPKMVQDSLIFIILLILLVWRFVVWLTTPVGAMCILRVLR